MLFDEAQTSGGKVVLIRGEAGIGKSSLVNEFAKLRSDDAHFLVGACDDLRIQQPLSPFWDMARSEPTLMELISSGDRPGVIQALMDLLSRSSRPTAMVIEDTHWADEATLDVIKYLGRRIARTNALLLVTYRSGEVDYDHPLRNVFGELDPQSVDRIELKGLTLPSITSMLTDSELDPVEVMAATDGNPFLVTEMASAGGSVVPSSLQDVVLARANKLSPGAMALLRTLSVIPEPIPRSDVVRLVESADSHLEECERRGFLQMFQGGQYSPRLVLDRGFGLEDDVHLVGFRHDLIRRALEATLTDNERLEIQRTVLETLPEATHPCLLIHCAFDAKDIDRLLDLAPRSALYAATIGSHRQAVEDFRVLRPHLSKLDRDDIGHLFEVWAQEEFLIDNIPEAISVLKMALAHYTELEDHPAESRVLALLSHFYENSGQREQAEEFAAQAIAALGDDPDGADLAFALEANAYLHWMAHDWDQVPLLVERTLKAGGPDIDERIRVRSLAHLGMTAHMADYPSGRPQLEEARERAAKAGEWYEECRALMIDGWAAAEFRDLEVASDYAQRAIGVAVRHELSMLEKYSMAVYGRVLEMKGQWAQAEDLAHDLSDASAITRMVALPVLGSIEARRGRENARKAIAQAWELASVAAEEQRLTQAAIAAAEHGWITGNGQVTIPDLREAMERSLDKGFQWSPGALAFWLWKLGELTDTPEGIAEPYRLVIEGQPLEAAVIWESKGLPYDRALALMHGDDSSRIEALEAFETLGATAVAGKLRQALRKDGVSVPRGRGQHTRRHAAGLTARQAEVLQLLNEGMTNIQISDRLFVSPRTVENHVAAILSKLESSTRDHAVSRAREEGLVTAPA